MTASLDLDAPFAPIARAIDASGYAVVPEFIDGALAAALRGRALALDAAGLLAEAGVGRGPRRVRNRDVRGDRIHWLDERQVNTDERTLLGVFEALRQALNAHLTLGLFELEAHYAVYPPGARYVAHRDRFSDDDTRVVSCVLYLNEQWQADEGGMLRLQVSPAPVDVAPRAGTLVAFLSDRTIHEVLPATRARVSLAAWFARRR